MFGTQSPLVAQVSNHTNPAVSSLQVQQFLNKAIEENADIIATFATVSRVLKETSRQYYEEDDLLHGHHEFDVGFLDEIKVSDENNQDEAASDAATEPLNF